MDKVELVGKLGNILSRQNSKGRSDIEADHSDADDLLVEYINDPEIKSLYEEIHKWYA